MLSNKNKEGPHIKFCENNICTIYNKARNKGANIDEGRGIKNVSLVNNFTKSNAI
jgi:hypothetical protein